MKQMPIDSKADRAAQLALQIRALAGECTANQLRCLTLAAKPDPRLEPKGRLAG